MPRLNPEEAREILKREFAEIDANHDGVLSLLEL
jgi:hypothetical protein